VAVDSRDRVFLFTRSDSEVLIYNRDGTFQKAWGKGLFTPRSHGITIGPDDSVYCVDDADQTVRKFSPDGELLLTIGTSGQASDTGYDGASLDSITHGGPPFNRPTNLAVAPSGDLYISDGYGNARVHRFAPDGRLIQSWGEPGSGPGQFRLSHGIGVAADGRVFVCDRHNDRLQIFTPEGEYLDEWTGFALPTHVVFDRNGLVYVSELRARVSVLDPTGQLLARWGDAPDSCAPGNFVAPHGLAVDSNGDLYIAEVVWTIGIRPGKVPQDCHAFQKFTRRS
jgi:DNA-binding beta-propeller fold protein YncE